ncbi:MAG: ABC transporter substrate-binding protein [Candidatus Eiseniibacteriota bacterium]
MSRPTLALALFAAALAATPALAKDKITYAYLLDPSIDAVMYAIHTGKVKSDKIDVETKSLAIPALIQATAAKTYDVVMTAVIGIPRANSQGLKLTILSTALRYSKSGEGSDIWVKADSPIKTVKDLKDKTIGVYALNSTGITWVRLALWRNHGMNVSYKDGDSKWVEMPAPALPGALLSGKIDAATLIHSQAYKAAESGQFRTLVRTAADNYAYYKVRPVAAVNVGYPEKIAERPEAYKEFDRMLKASVDYALAHLDEVSAAVGKEKNIEPGFFKAWFTRFSDFPAAVSDADLKAIETNWKESKELGLIKDYPDVKTLVWKDAIRE